jgi:hypothetical protein
LPTKIAFTGFLIFANLLNIVEITNGSGHLTSCRTCVWAVIFLTDKSKITIENKINNKEITMDSGVLIAVVFISVVAVVISISRKKK